MRYAIPGSLAVAWLVLVLTHRRMPYPSDQLNYFEAAARFPAPLPSDLIHQMTRFGLIAPTRLAIAVFGYSETSYYFMPLLGGLLLLLGTYVIGTLLFSRLVGVAAAAVMMTYTPIFTDATELMPDVVATGLFTTAVAIALAVRQERLPAAPWTLLLIGFLLAWSYMVREYIVFVWPLVPVLLWPRLQKRGPLWHGLLWLAVPVVVMGAVETLLCWSMYGSPLARVRAVIGVGNSNEFLNQVADTYRDKPMRVYLVQLWSVLNGNGPSSYYSQHWIMRPLLLAAIAGMLVRPRRLWIFGLWLVLMWVPLTLLGGVIDPGNPKLRLQVIRYWFPLVPALVLGGIGAIWLGLRLLTRRVNIPAAAAALPVIGVACVAGSAILLGVREWSGAPATFRGVEDMAAFRTWMSRHDEEVDRVWTDGKTARILKVYRQGPAGGRSWTATVRPLNAGSPVPGDVVLLFDTEDGKICGVCRQRAGQALGTPIRTPANWRQVYTNPGGTVRIYTVTPPGPNV